MKEHFMRPLWWYLAVAVGFCLIFQGWGAIINAIGVLAAAVVPIILGLSIAYILAIPLGYFERHFFPASDSKAVEVMRRPVCLGLTIIIVIVVLFLSVYTVIPAFTEVLEFIRNRLPAFLDEVIALSIFDPIRDNLQQLIQSDFVQSLLRLDFVGLFQSGFGSVTPDNGMQIFSALSTVMTGFFGMVFSFIMLTDTSDAPQQFMRILGSYLGPKRMEKFMMVVSVADAAFHNFLVRQSIEASILAAVGATVLTIAGYQFALGVATFMFVSAMIPVVGYPVGLFAGTLMVVVSDPLAALFYLVLVAVAQMLEATFLLPHVGDPRTTLPPVWTAVAVTLGGGIAGFVGMLIAIPTASTVYQLIRIDLAKRKVNLLDLDEQEDYRQM